MLNIKENYRAYAFLFLSCFISSNLMAHGQMEVTKPPIDVASFPPINEDIVALASYSGYAGAAGQRLIERGVEVLTQAHGVLGDPNSPFIQRMQVITVLGEIADESSAKIIIQAAEKNVNNRYLYQNALLALNKFEPTDSIKSFVNRQLEMSQRDPIIQRTALVYYAEQPSKDANKWVDVYAATTASDEVRYAALYLGGVLGRKDVKPEIIKLLQSGQVKDREYYLLLGYANVSTLAEFNALVEAEKLNKDNVNKVREFLLFHLASDEAKRKLAPNLLKSINPQLKQAAVKILIDDKSDDTLVTSWQQGDGVVRAAVRRAGYTVEVSEQGTLLKRTDNKTFPINWIVIVTALGILLLFLLLLLKRRS